MDPIEPDTPAWQVLHLGPDIVKKMYWCNESKQAAGGGGGGAAAAAMHTHSLACLPTQVQRCVCTHPFTSSLAQPPRE